jgi:hypothetical protein
MRCSASPITCTAKPQPAAEMAAPSASSVFAELLVRLAFRPLARPLGFYGDIVIDACARTMARGEPFHGMLPPTVATDAGEAPQ